LWSDKPTFIFGKYAKMCIHEEIKNRLYASLMVPMGETTSLNFGHQWAYCSTPRWHDIDRGKLIRPPERSLASQPAQSSSSNSGRTGWGIWRHYFSSSSQKYWDRTYVNIGLPYVSWRHQRESRHSGPRYTCHCFWPSWPIEPRVPWSVNPTARV
jgi:hypothetical protein